MLRCPRCGLRLRADAPLCPEHGAAPARSAADQTGDLEASAFDHDVVALLAPLDIEVGRLLGRGGFGVVYAATRGRESAPLALKVARSGGDAALRLAREAQLLAKLAPPLVPELVWHAEQGELAFILMEQILSPTLATRLAEAGGPLPHAELDALAAALFAALEQLHARGIAHLDLKPENIFVAAMGVRIIDFGMARDQRTPPDLAALEQAIGTAEYMSPEQCEGKLTLDHRSDIYSLGVLLYELAAGSPPFFGNAADVREAQRSQRPPPLPARLGLPRSLDHVVRRCLAKDRARRFDDIAALRTAFQTALRTPQRAISLKPAPAPVAGATASEKRPMGLLFFASAAGLGSVGESITSSGGLLAHQQGSQYVAAFSHEVGDNPVHAALSTAQRIVARGLADRVLVELATVSVQTRPDGSRRLLSALFMKRDRYPSLETPAGITLTRAAADVLSELPLVKLPGASDRFMLEPAQRAHEMTSFALDAAPLVGRDDVLRELAESAERAFSAARPTLFTVLADAGLGKTHLAGTLALRLPGTELLRFTARELTIGAESQLLAELLGRVLELPAAASPATERAVSVARTHLVGRLSSTVDEQVIAAALFVLGYLDVQHPEVRRIAAAPGALRLAAARAAGEALRVRARDRPLALVLDDAHMADEATLDALELATFADARARIWICALARPSFASARPNWGRRSAEAPRTTLGPLSEAAAEELAHKLLQPIEFVPPRALARLRERTQGIPALLVELVRGLKREGIVRRSERGTGHYLATDALESLPDLPIVAWNASREFEALPAPLAEHAKIAAVLSAEFALDELEALLQVLELEEPAGQVQLDAAVGVERLIDAGILVRRRGRRFDFRHALLRETVYQRIPSARRQQLHRAALAIYRSAEGASERRLPRLALHAARSGERELAADVYLALAHSAQQTHSYLEAEAAFGSALEQLAEAPDARVVTASRGRGLMRFRLGRHEDALGDLRRARQQSRGEHALQLMLDEAMVLDWTRDFVHSAELTREAERHAGPRSGLARARLAMSLARVHHRQGESLACVRLGSEAAELAAALGDEGYETRVGALLMVAPDCVNLGRLDEAEDHFESVIVEARTHGDLLHLGAAHVNRALLWFARKDAKRLFDDLGQGAQIARELGAPLIEYPARINMGEVAYALEELERATEHTERAMALARQLWGEDNRELGMCELLLARIALHRDELEQVRAWTTSVRTRMDEARAAGRAESDFLPPEQALLEMVELSTQDASAAEWDALELRCRAVDMQPHEQVAILESRALAALRAGRREESKLAFERAIALSEATPNLLGERVVRKHRALFAS